MKVDITGRHIEVTDALREHAEDKLGKIDKILDGPSEAHVVLFIEKHRHVAEIQLKNRAGVFSGQEETDDLYVSIDAVVDKLEKQVRRFKDKRNARRRRDGIKAGEAAAALQPAEEAGEEEGDLLGGRIVRSDQYRVKPLTPEDAAIELETSGRDVLVFRDAETERISVLHRLADGNFGLVDPEV